MARGRKRKKKKAEVIPALSLACVTYLRRCVLWEPATECMRRPQRARESRSECERGSGGLQGAPPSSEQSLFPLRRRGTGVNRRTRRYDSRGGREEVPTDRTRRPAATSRPLPYQQQPPPTPAPLCGMTAGEGWGGEEALLPPR